MTFDQICRVFREQKTSNYSSASYSLIENYADDMDVSQTAELASAIAASGESIDLPTERAPYCDVPSSGGPASLTTLLCPIILASTGIPVPKISATGSMAGAIDTLGIIPGFRTALGLDEFLSVLEATRIAHCAQTEQMCPADKALIKVRRETARMRHPQLAAASLLSKKLIVLGANAVFDFRLGPTGNIADDHPEGRRIAEFFHQVADRLGIKISIVLTRCDTFCCSALGRLESLSLLCSILKGEKLNNELDIEHKNTCITITRIAREMSSQVGNSDRHGMSLDNGEVWPFFLKHIEAQGGSLQGIEYALSIRDKQKKIVVHAGANGWWHPPDLEHTKNWLKSIQKTYWERNNNQNEMSLEMQFGIRFLVQPGTKVNVEQPVAEFRFPPNAEITDDYDFLSGSISESQSVQSSQIIDVIK